MRFAKSSQSLNEMIQRIYRSGGRRVHNFFQPLTSRFAMMQDLFT